MAQSTIRSYLPKTEGAKPVIYVDSREAANRNGRKIINEIERLGAEVNITKLDFGDYVLSEDVAVERKTVFDLASTLTDRFLFDQIFRMRDAYPNALVIIEGYMGVLRKFRRITPEAINGTLFALAQRGVPMVPTVDYKDTAHFLVVGTRKLTRETRTLPTIRHRVRTENIYEKQLYLITGLPHVGSVIANNLLKYFATPRRVLTASADELMEVGDVGPKIAKDIATVLDTPYLPEGACETDEEQ